jgi:peptidoglycan L-alanyl-D-glutamate endopeptidase CwlK
MRVVSIIIERSTRMPIFSERSRVKLSTCHPSLKRLFERVIERRDCAIICGHRGEAEQNDAVETGHSKLKFPFSKHNSFPSTAVDVMPYHWGQPHIRWEDTESTYNFIGYVQGIADELNIKIRNGSDWDDDHDFHDQSFMDLPHFELVLDD